MNCCMAAHSIPHEEVFVVRVHTHSPSLRWSPGVELKYALGVDILQSEERRGTVLDGCDSGGNHWLGKLRCSRSISRSFWPAERPFGPESYAIARGREFRLGTAPPFVRSFTVRVFILGQRRIAKPAIGISDTRGTKRFGRGRVR